MPNINEMEPHSGRFIGEDGKAYNIVDMLSPVPVSRGTAGNFRWEKKGTTLTISGTGYFSSGMDTNIDVSDVTELIIENGITGFDASKPYPLLKSVSIASSCHIIGRLHYHGETLAFPDTVTMVGRSCLANNTEIVNFIADGVTMVNDYMFDGCTNLKNVVMGGIQSVGYAPFSRSGVEILNIPSTCTMISGQVCYNSSLTKINIDNSRENVNFNTDSVPETVSIRWLEDN